MSWHDITSKTYYDVKCLDCNFKEQDISSSLEALEKAKEHIETVVEYESPFSNHDLEITDKIVVGRKL